MQAVIDKILGLLAQNNGKMSYESVLAEMDLNERSNLPAALKEAKRKKLFKTHLAFNKDLKHNELSVITFPVEAPVTPENGG